MRLGQFENWTSAIRARVGGLDVDRLGYADIVRAIELGIGEGEIPDEARLPPQRILAQALGVATGTVSQAYSEAKRRGYVRAQVGAGTFVSARSRSRPPAQHSPATREEGFVDLTVNTSPELDTADFDPSFLRGAAGDLRRKLLSDSDRLPEARHQEAGAEWLLRSGIRTDPNRVIVCNGVQQALTALLGVLMVPGELCVTEHFNYPGLKLLAQFLRLDLQGLEMDQEGLLPEAFEEACRSRVPKVLLCTPTLQNPTAAVMSLSRRKAIAKVAGDFGVTIIEDDLYGCVPLEAPARISSLDLCDSIYVTGLSKPISRKLRIGYIASPTNLVGDLSSAIRATSWMVSPLLSHLATDMILDGTADQVVARHRERAQERMAVAQRVLGLANMTGCARYSYHAWLPLAPGWRAGTFALEARKQGVSVLPSEAFSVNLRVPCEAVRISLGAAKTEAELTSSLSRLRSILELGPTTISPDIA